MTIVLFSSASIADATFSGDTNQISSNAPNPSYDGDIIVGDKETSGTSSSPSGTLLVDNGTNVSGSDTLIVGNGKNSSGKVSVTGMGTTLTFTLYKNSYIGKGDGSYGELNISDGASVKTAPLVIGALNIQLG